MYGKFKHQRVASLSLQLILWWFFWLFYPCIRYFENCLSREKDQLFPWNLMNLYKSLWNFEKFQKRFKCHFSKKNVEHWSLVKTCEFWIEWNQISDMGDHTSTFMYICSGGQLSKIESPFCFEMSYILARRSFEVCMIQAGL